MSDAGAVGGYDTSFDRHMIGILELGIVTSMVLHGVIIASSVSYYRHYVQDVTYVRVVIGILWLLSTAHAGLLLWSLYQVTILRLGEPSDQFVMPVTIPLSMTFSSMMQSIVQAVFTYRMYRFSKKLWSAMICWLLATFELAGTLIYTLSLPYNSVEAQNQHQIQYTWLVFSFLASAAIVDAAIAVTIAVYLHHGKSSAIGSNTIRAVDQLETWTLRTGTLTSFLALAIAVNFGIDRKNNLWIAMYIILTNLYPLTLMTLFNGRRELTLYEEFGISMNGINIRTITDNNERTRSISTIENGASIHTKRTATTDPTPASRSRNKFRRMRGDEPPMTTVVVSLEVISDSLPSASLASPVTPHRGSTLPASIAHSQIQTR